MRNYAKRFVKPALRQSGLLGLVTVFSASAVLGQTGRAEEVFRYEQTLAVAGMPEIRAALPAGAAHYKPVLYQPDKRVWAVIADSIPAYKATREAGLTNDQPALVETREAENADGQLPSPNFSASPTPPASYVSLAPRPVTAPVPIKKPAALSCPRPAQAAACGNDPVIYFKCGDAARAHAAACRLCAEGLPITQANMNRELGYASTPSCSSCCGSGNSCGRASGCPSTSPAPANKNASASPGTPRPAGHASAAQTVPSAIQGNSSVVSAPLRSYQARTPMPVQQFGGARRFSVGGRSR
jgi:hypothetical protein